MTERYVYQSDQGRSHRPPTVGGQQLATMSSCCVRHRMDPGWAVSGLHAFEQHWASLVQGSPAGRLPTHQPLRAQPSMPTQADFGSHHRPFHALQSSSVTHVSAMHHPGEYRVLSQAGSSQGDSVSSAWHAGPSTSAPQLAANDTDATKKISAIALAKSFVFMHEI